MKQFVQVQSVANLIGQGRHERGPTHSGILNGQSGAYSDSSGLGSVVAARRAAEEFQAAQPSIPVEIVSVDHANKPDVASAIARRWLETEGIDAVADIQNSAVALAVQNIANQDHKVSLATGAVRPELSGTRARSLTRRPGEALNLRPVVRGCEARRA